MLSLRGEWPSRGGGLSDDAKEAADGAEDAHKEAADGAEDARKEAADGAEDAGKEAADGAEAKGPPAELAKDAADLANEAVTDEQKDGRVEGSGVGSKSAEVSYAAAARLPENPSASAADDSSVCSRWISDAALCGDCDLRQVWMGGSEWLGYGSSRLMV